LLSLVLPKGSLERATLDLFEAADLPVRRLSECGYSAVIDDPRIERVRFNGLRIMDTLLKIVE
jgi:ATP phosphoribosyltransferase